MSQFTEADSAVNRLSAAVTAFEKVLTEPEGAVVEMPVGAAQPSLSERLKRAIDAVTVKPAQAAAQATAAAQQAQTAQQAAAQSAADAANSAAATGYVDAPFPDVWAPLNDDLRLLAGFAPADTITVAGTSYPLPSKSMTFTRSTTATYIDKSGVLKTAAVNEPRFEKEGLLLEGQSTNYFLNSDDPTKWNSDAGITKEMILDGTTQANTLKGTATTASSSFLLLDSSTVTVVSGETLTLSARFKGASDRIRFGFTLNGALLGTIFIDCVSGAVVGSPTAGITYTITQGSDGYIYASATFTANASGAITGNIRFISATTIAIGSIVYVQTPQFEKNPVATSYIPTGAAAVTRGSESLNLQASGNCGFRITGDLFNRTVSMTLAINKMGLQSGSYHSAIATSGASNDIICRVLADDIRAYRGAGGPTISTTYPMPQKVLTQTLDDTNKMTLYLDGFSNSSTSAPVSPSGIPTNITLGANPAVVYHVRNFRIWHRVLTPNQINGLR